MRVWVSRSQPGADRQASALRAAGHHVLTAPVLGVEPSTVAPPDGEFQQLVFLSEHAVRMSTALQICRMSDTFAVGPGTARALSERGVKARVAEPASSEGLLRIIPVDAGQKILIIAGEGGRKLVRDALLTRGAMVSEYLCYRRELLPVNLSRILPLDALLVSSQDGFRQVARLWFELDGRADVPVLAASTRIGRLGAELGFKNVHISAGALSQDWIEGLEHVAARGVR